MASTLTERDAGVIDTARRRFEATIEAESSWRREALTDLKFKAGTDGDKSYQWDETIQSQRNSEQRPCLTINRLPSFIKQVVNQQRQAGPTIQISPVGDGDEDVAEAFQGIIRHILTLSDGEIAVDTAFENAVSCGAGYIVVVPRYVDGRRREQELYIDWVPNPFVVYLDAAAMKPDKSDAKYGFRVEDIPREEYDAAYGDRYPVTAGDLSSIGDVQRGRWFPGGAVRIADYYEVKNDRVIWRKITGLDVIEQTVLPIRRVPIVPCYGDQVYLDGKVDYRGMVRDAREPQRAYNYWFTAATEQIALSTKAPWLVDPRQIEGLEQFWKVANQKNLTALPYKRYVELNGQQIDMGVPERNTAEPPIQAMTVALNVSDQALKQVMSLYEPSLGQRKSDQSGRAILALQQQGEIGNANYIDNLKRFLRSLGRLLVEMIPHYYDAPRVVRIIGKEEQPKTIMVHTGQSDRVPEALPRGVKQVYDLSVGRYDVTVTTGPSFVSKRQEQLERLLEFLKVDPPAAPISGDIIARLMEIPELESRLKKTLPPQFQEDQQGPEAQVAGLQRKLQMVLQQHDLLVKELNAKTQAIETDQVKYASQASIKQAEFNFQLELQKLKNAATIAVAEINAQTKGVVSAQEAQHEALALLQTQAHDVGMSELEHAQAIEQAQQAHDHALEQGEQGIGGQLATQAQSAALQPPPQEASAE